MRDYDFTDIIDAQAERLMSEHDMDPSEARHTARTRISKSRKYMEEDSYFDDVSED